MMEKGHPQGKEKWRFIWGGGKRFPLLNYHVLSPMHQQINWLVRMSSPVLLHWAWRREFFLGFGLFKFSHWNIDRDRLQLTIIFQKDKSCRGLNRGWAGRTDSSTAKPMNCSTDSILSAIDFGLQYGHLSILDLGFNTGIFLIWIWEKGSIVGQGSLIGNGWIFYLKGLSFAIDF